MKILVTGASGLLGLNLCMRISEAPGHSAAAGESHSCVGVTNSHPLNGAPFPTLSADLGKPGEAQRLLSEHKPDVVIHCAALANLDACEADPVLAHRLNAGVPGELAQLCARSRVRFVHVSTDAVFDGQKGSYTEDDEPHPINVYAGTKLVGERMVTRANPDAIIARVNFYGWSLFGKRSLAEFFFTNLRDGKQVNGFRDVYFCPLQVCDLADTLLEMAAKGLSGLYHVVSPEYLSKEAFGRRIARRFGFDEALIQSVSVSDGGLVAVRSPNLTLRNDKVTQALGHLLPKQDAGLERFYTQYAAGFPEKIRGMAG